MDEQAVRERAYEIWEEEGRPEGREEEHWRRARREVAIREGAMEDEKEDLESARNYDNKVKQFEKSGRVGPAAEEARRAIDGPEKKELKRAEEIGKNRARGNDAGGQR